MQRTPLLLPLVALITACDSRRESPAPSPPPTTIAVPETAATALTAIDPPTVDGSLAPNLRATPDGVLATWIEPAGDSHRLRFARLSGSAWAAPTTVAEGPKLVANWADVPAVERAADGALVAWWAEKSGGEAHAYDAVVARSIDGGASWQRIGPLHDDGTATEHGFVSLVPDGAGVRAYWLDGRATTRAGGATALRTAVIDARVHDAAVIDDRVCDCCGTSAAMTPAGAIVTYRDRTDAEVRDIHVARAGAQDRLVHADGWRIAGCPVNGPSVAAQGDLVAVAWYTYADSVHRVRVAFSTDGGASFGPPIVVDEPRGARAPLGRVALVLDDDGDAIVSWLASTREDATILARRVRRDAVVGGELEIARSIASRDAGFPRMVRDGGDVVVAWTAPGTASRIRAARVALSAFSRTASSEPAVAATPPALQPGSAAPGREWPSLDGSPASLHALRGEVVLVNLWATWCEPCRHELPELVTLHTRHRNRGLRVVGLNVDQARSAEEVAAFVRKRKIPFAVWLDPDDGAATAFGASTYPVNLLIDRQGVVRWRRDGAIAADDADLAAAIDAAFAEAR